MKIEKKWETRVGLTACICRHEANHACCYVKVPKHLEENRGLLEEFCSSYGGITFIGTPSVEGMEGVWVGFDYADRMEPSEVLMVESCTFLAKHLVFAKALLTIATHEKRFAISLEAERITKAILGKAATTHDEIFMVVSEELTKSRFGEK